MVLEWVRSTEFLWWIWRNGTARVSGKSRMEITVCSHLLLCSVLTLVNLITVESIGMKTFYCSWRSYPSRVGCGNESIDQIKLLQFSLWKMLSCKNCRRSWRPLRDCFFPLLLVTDSKEGKEYPEKLCSKQTEVLE